MALKNSGATPSSCTSTPRWGYDVFVSFRGEDTRKSFTDHLFNALDQKGITNFRDDRTLERGKPISAELIRAIEESRFAVVVFSRNYASSTWCLDELVKIVECTKVMGQTVLPIFYDVDPSQVRKQEGPYATPFTEYEQTCMDKVQKWREALTYVANLSGWALEDRHESIIIQDIVRGIFSKLSKSFSSFHKELVGMESRLQEMESYLAMELNEVRMVGICGMGGIGKTTLARVAYDVFSDQFESSSFLVNVSEVSRKRDLTSLQEQLLSELLKDRDVDVWDVHKGINMIRERLRSKRVLLILDDVDKIEQLEGIAGKHEWFGPGSRVIITTRDEHLLIAHGVNFIYKANGLYGDEALQLLSWKAFRQNHPKEDYLILSKRITYYADGLPLALEVLGSFLYGRSANEWESALKRLKEIPERKIFDVLKLSFDGLEEVEQNIFLDIACFFKGKKISRLIEVLDSFDFYPEIGIRVLIDKSLITAESGKILMHSLLQEMGWAIVRQECLKEPGRRSRLWLFDDIGHVLTKNTGTEAVEGIFLSSLESKEIRLDMQAFSKMNNLRLLKIHDVQLPKGLEFLSNELRILKWQGYPLKSMPSTFKPENLVELIMCHSRIEQLWNRKVRLDKLKLIKLSHSKSLTKTPNFTQFPNLERLILEGCVNLDELHPSIGDLERLISLNLKDCRKLPSLPSCICGLKSLRSLCLCGCTKLDKLPEKLGDLENLEELDVGETAIRQTPSSMLLLKNLKKLSFQGCKGQPPKAWNLIFGCLLPGVGPDPIGFSLPSSFSGLLSLTELDLSDCNLFEGAIPNDLVTLSALKKLNLSRNCFVSLPVGINQLTRLQDLKLERCHMLEALPELPSSIQELCTSNCSSMKVLSTPSDLGMSRNRNFMLNNCFELVKNHDNNNVAMKILKCHLFSLMERRLLVLSSIFPKLAWNQGSNHVALTILSSSTELFMNIMFQVLSLPPASQQPCANLIVNILSLMLQGLSDPLIEGPSLSILLSRSGIPDWFIHQRPGPSVIIGLPPHWSDDALLMGLAICAVFGVRDDEAIICSGYSPPGIRHILPPGYTHKLIFTLLSDVRGHVILNRYQCFKRDEFAVSDHLWLLYLPFDEYLKKQNWQHIESHFKSEGPGFEFKKCGIRMVYMRDILELNRTMFNLSQLENDLSVVVPLFLGSEVAGLGIEHSRDANHSNEESVPAGSGTCNDEAGHSASGNCDNEGVPSASVSCEEEPHGTASLQ
ncbi:LRR_1 domain-containing protein/NB-ARC domain-containing protein/TIR domain-containing protein [Cephalotus follicularis]|uniref:ADP-ribosyl cyclase/cyclic ADP-ribose hydrolase n=1 Tax=Cephalotus follicularis TaxID=3775 RepID=A0A1Q3B8X0_CEPFO|nr:LRR_1 domain-containing protein/NB-ARC domain-containing protein/TIR domain-containing protein [Cephalotus follicularis]